MHDHALTNGPGRDFLRRARGGKVRISRGGGYPGSGRLARLCSQGTVDRTEQGIPARKAFRGNLPLRVLWRGRLFRLFRDRKSR